MRRRNKTALTRWMNQRMKVKKKDEEETDMNLNGIGIAVISFICIGVFHPIVIKAEYFFSSGCWPAFLLVGAAFLAASVWVENTVISAALGVIGCSCLWSIGELKEQEKRVERGWFPENSKRRRRKEIKK